MSDDLRWRRVLIKLSGEALMGAQGFGIDSDVVARIVGDIADAVRLGARIGLVVGGGNIFRGVQVAAKGASRTTGDHMGMLGTVMNGLALADALRGQRIKARVFSAVQMPSICETFTQRAADDRFAAGEVLVFVGGTGNPFFTTDSGAALRAAEMECDALLKATNVDGIYSADPKKYPNAKRFDHLTHQDVLAKDLNVMDAAAIALARDNAIPVIVFSIHTPGALVDVLRGKGRATIVSD
ncbi:UMP kinase [Breoghania sp.]|uniref:UMP kinase n=1 Tax=Breoghania sp. TaxID=2065378 RepID=UPI002611C48A|nr:UMP kinase [Breoghania sp.]MDJ0929686.1 UMP kinase [Breoghania sp.]